jgi:hypothetical protein
MVIEKDDPGGDISIRDYLKASPVAVAGLDIQVYVGSELTHTCFGPEFLTWLEEEIRRRRVRLVVLDSYTALRPHRVAGKDIVKVESDEMMLLNQLGKRTGTLLLVAHHPSGGHLALDWTDQLGGTYALGAAVEGLIHLSRFRELAGDAPERLLQGQFRHGESLAAVVRFRRPTLDYELVLEGMAAPWFAELRQLKENFGDRIFTPHEVIQATGMARSTLYRLLEKLAWAGALKRVRYGEYQLAVNGI